MILRVERTEDSLVAINIEDGDSVRKFILLMKAMAVDAISANPYPKRDTLITF